MKCNSCISCMREFVTCHVWIVVCYCVGRDYIWGTGRVCMKCEGKSNLEFTLCWLYLVSNINDDVFGENAILYLSWIILHLFFFIFCTCHLPYMFFVKTIKSWVVGCWHGYMSGARCRYAYCPADATVTHYLLLVNPHWFYLFGTVSPWYSQTKGWCCCCCSDYFDCDKIYVQRKNSSFASIWIRPFEYQL